MLWIMIVGYFIFVSVMTLGVVANITAQQNKKIRDFL